MTLIELYYLQLEPSLTLIVIIAPHNTHSGLLHSTAAQGLRGQGFDSQEAHSNLRVPIKRFRSNLFREGILGLKSSVNLANVLINPNNFEYKCCFLSSLHALRTNFGSVFGPILCAMTQNLKLK